MGPMQIVFLFDLNACANLKSKEELYRKLLYVRLACLRLLNDLSAKSSSLKWGFKFYDSQGSKTQNMCKFFFAEMTLENFETFENEVCIRYERHASFLQALESSQNRVPSVNEDSQDKRNIDPPVKILQFALTQVLCEFQWETMDMWSPRAAKINNRKRNFLLVFSDFRDSDDDLFKFFGLNSLLSKSKFLNIFLPQSLRDSILKKANIHLILLNICIHQKFLGSFKSKILSLLSESLNSIKVSFIPLSILSQPLFNIRVVDGLEKNLSHSKESLISNLPSGYRNSFIPFSTLFEQCLHHPFYLKSSTSDFKHYIHFPSEDLQIPIQIIEISNKKISQLHTDSNIEVSSSVKSNHQEDKKDIWSKFNVHGAVPNTAYFQAYKFIVCVQNNDESSLCEVATLQMLIKNLSELGIYLLLECITENGFKEPGFLTPLSPDTAVISILDPSINFSNGNSYCKASADCSLQKENFEHDICNEVFSISDNKLESHNVESSDRIIITKPFQMECLEPWFKPKNLSGLSAYIESNHSNTSSKMEAYWKLLKQSVKKKTKSKHVINQLTESNSVDQKETVEGQLPDDEFNHKSEIEVEEDLPSDLNYEELLLAVRNAYDSAIEPSGNIITASKRIVKMMSNYCKKNNSINHEEDVNNIFKEHFLMTAKKLIDKYNTLDSEEATEKKIKECKIQISLILEVESVRICPDKSNCVSSIISLLAIASFCFSKKGQMSSGLKELKSFLQEILKKSSNSTLYDILVEVGDEYEQTLDDSESTCSPAETVSSEFNNDEDLFGSAVSTMSVKSSSSTGSRNEYKETKDKNALDRKLLRRRSDISETSKYRQVLLPKSSPKKKKAKVAANKAVRYSPRLAAKKSNVSALNEKPNKVRRNLFAGDKPCRTPKKNGHLPCTPKHKKKKEMDKATDTPFHKQDYSFITRRKSDCLSNSSIIEESPLSKTVEHQFKDLFEKANQGKLSSANEEQKNDYTPESKRLSLKLFSKPFSSPTARQGIKKITKRLFDQISPLKTFEDSKRHKPNVECEMSSSTKNQK